MCRLSSVAQNGKIYSLGSRNWLNGAKTGFYLFDGMKWAST